MTTDAEPGGGSAPQPMLTVAAVARRLGVAPSTLRTWDRRYGLGPSAHTAGSHRRYSAADLGRLVVMRGLTLEGVPPAEAAQIALTDPGPAPGPRAGAARTDPAPSPNPAPSPALGQSAAPGPSGAPGQLGVLGHPWAWAHPGAVGDPGVPAVPETVQVGDAPRAGIPAARDAGLDDDTLSVLDLQLELELDRQPGRGLHHRPGADHGPGADPGPGFDPRLDLPGPDDAGLRRASPRIFPLWSSSLRPGGGRVMSLPDGSPQARGLARAAMSLDPDEVTRLLRDAIGVYGVVSTWEAMAVPVLRAIGERWRVTGDGIDVEHAFCEAAAGVLRGVTATVRRPKNSCPILLACAEGDHHTLPLHVLAAALAEEEISCRMLGTGMPAAALVAAVRRTGPAVVFVYARLAVTNSELLHELPRQRPAPRVVIGGSGWADTVPPGAVVRVGSLAAALDEVLAAVHV